MSVRPLTFQFFISPLPFGRLFTNFIIMILDTGPHNRSVTDFFISVDLTQK